MIVVHLTREGAPLADVIYRAGMLVEIRVSEKYQSQRISFQLRHSDNPNLEGQWEEALDKYFNEGLFDARDMIFKGDMRRIGTAREHRSLFQHAAHALLKDLEPHGYRVEVEFE
jgi:hypothetical protein